MARRPIFGRNIQAGPGGIIGVDSMVGWKEVEVLGWKSFHGELGTEGTDRTVVGSEK